MPQMASQEPTEDEIWNVIDFANLNPQHDRPMIIQALKVLSSAQVVFPNCDALHRLENQAVYPADASLLPFFQDNSRNVESVVIQYFDDPAAVRFLHLA